MKQLRLMLVTPFVGVWIETSKSMMISFKRLSHPSWVCGLKQRNNPHKLQSQLVTPFVGVWIETIEATSDLNVSSSHPSWVCGLKQRKVHYRLQGIRSHTLRGCVD